MSDESKLKYSLLGVLTIHGTTNLMAKRLNASEDPHAYTKTNFKFRGLPYYAYVLFYKALSSLLQCRAGHRLMAGVLCRKALLCAAVCSVLQYKS